MAKPIETLSPTDEAIFRTATLKSLQGAAEDPERIGTEYLPEVAEVNGFELVDSSTVALAAGVTGWNESLNCFVRHDGTTIGGNQIISTDPLEFRGAHVEQNFTSAKIIRLFEAPLTALQAAVGRRFRVSGRVFISLVGSNFPPVFNLGMITKSEVDDDLSGVGRFPVDFDGSTPVLMGYTYSTTSKDTWDISLVSEYMLTDASPNVELAFYSSKEKAVVYNGGTLSGVSNDTSTAIGVINPVGLAGTANESLIFEIQAQANGASGGAMHIHYDLKFEQTA
jgi:hypothetical protein